MNGSTLGVCNGWIWIMLLFFLRSTICSFSTCLTPLPRTAITHCYVVDVHIHRNHGSITKAHWMYRTSGRSTRRSRWTDWRSATRKRSRSDYWLGTRSQSHSLALCLTMRYYYYYIHQTTTTAANNKGEERVGITLHSRLAAVRSAATVCHAVWSCSRTVSRAVNIAVDTTCCPRTPSWYRASHEPRGPSSSSLAPSTVTAPVCMSYRKRIVDRSGLLFPNGTDRFHLESPKDGKAKSVTAMEYYWWRLMQRDGRAWTSCCAATGCSSSTPYTVDACAKMEQQRLNYLWFNQNSRRS